MSEQSFIYVMAVLMKYFVWGGQSKTDQFPSVEAVSVRPMQIFARLNLINKSFMRHA